MIVSCRYSLTRDSLIAQLVKNPPAMQETLVQFLGQEDLLEKMWRKGNPPTLLVGMKVDAAMVENSMEVPQKTINRIAI